MTTRPSPVALTGSTGRLGGRVTALLAEQGLPLRLVCRDPARAPRVGAEVVQASYADAPAMRAALEGVRTLFLVSAAENEHRLDEHRSAVAAAGDAGVEHVVYTSFLGAGPDATFTLARDHFHTEQMLRDAVPAWTFLRDALYADFFPLMVGEDDVLRGPAGRGRVATVTTEDVARSAAAVLLDPAAHAGRTYDLTGPEALTLDEVARTVAAATGRPVRYVDETVEEAYASRAPYGAPRWQVDAWVSTYTAIAAGEQEHVSGHVERLTGRPATSLADLLR